MSCFLLSTLCARSQSRHVVLISIDGLRPEMYLDSGWPTPNLQRLMKQGVYARRMKSVFPAYTYPSHTAMISGALPARSHIWFNQPKGSKGEWNWWYDSIATPTLWTACRKAGPRTAAVEWPVTLGAPIDWVIPEIWDIHRPDDRIDIARGYATPGLVEEIEREATGRLDSNNFSDGRMSIDENIGRMAAYIFRTRKPWFLAVHVFQVDGMEHEFGRTADSVRLAVATDDHAIGDVLEAIQRSGLQDSTTVMIVGDHGMADIREVCRPNMMIRGLPARFIAAGGSAFLYVRHDSSWAVRRDSPGGASSEMVWMPRWSQVDSFVVKRVTGQLNKLPKEKRRLIRIVDRKELDAMGADSSAVLALAAVPGLVFSSATSKAAVVNHGPGTQIQQDMSESLFIPTHGGHHGYDPDEPEMYTGFIAFGAGVEKGRSVPGLTVTDIAPLVAALLGIRFNCPDGRLVEGILARD